MSRALFISGVRTPFQLPLTGYSRMTAVELLASAFTSLLNKLPIERSEIHHVTVGTVFQHNKITNIAGEAASSVNISSPAHNITMACISGQAAVGEAVNLIQGGSAELVLVGGVEYLSDIRIQLSKELRKTLLPTLRIPRLTKERFDSVVNYEFTKSLCKTRFKHLKPEYLRVVEFSTQETFLFNGDKISNKFSVSREEQDEYAFRSHLLSNAAAYNGKFDSFLCPVSNPYTNIKISTDSTLRPWKREKIQAMKSVSRKGTVTFASANQPCDGAAAILLASEQAAERLNLVPHAVVSPVSFSASSPKDKLLMGTTHSLAALQKHTGREISDVDVIELYEGFAGEVLSQIKAMRSLEYCRENLGLSEPVADLEMERINRWGGSIGLGHPFGATGLRLLLHSVGRMEEGEGSSAVVAGCAGGGLGAAFFVDKL